jgi:hypothetical protein
MRQAVAVIGIGFVICAANVLAQTQRARVETNDPTKHHQDVTLRVSVDHSAAFTIPSSDSPIRVDLSASAVGLAGGTQPHPILRSATLIYATLLDAILMTAGNDPAVVLDQTGTVFANAAGTNGVRMAILLARSAAVPKQLVVSVPEPISAMGQQYFNQIEVRISAWY